MLRNAPVLLLSVALQGVLFGCSTNQTGPAPSDGRLASPGFTAVAANFNRDIAPLFNTYCTGCHSAGRGPEGIDLDFANEEAAREKAITEDDFWQRVSRNLASGQMPPPYAPRKPSDAERQVLGDWISNSMLTTNGMPDPGPFVVRRLNNREYANTVRELLYLPAEFDAAADFPAEERGAGFDNNAETLTISPLLIERYLQANENATVVALGLNSISRDSSLDSPVLAPGKASRTDYASYQGQVRVNLETFLPRAFRRPVTGAEIDQLMKYAALSFAHGAGSINAATGLAIRAALLWPDFLFRLEKDPNPDGTGKVFEITEYQLATRLSYALWNTMPDDSLYIAARDGTLRQNLDHQINRMLADPKSISLTRDFLGQWLEIRGLREIENVPDELLEAMLGETEHFFDYIVRNDRSIMEFLDSDYTFLNEDLATLYGIEGVQGSEFRKVQVDRARRGGIFTQASFLTLTSKPLGSGMRTSPVMRGKWILENIFNEAIPPPPANVPSLNIDPNQELEGTVRQIFEQHRADPMCAGCHSRMDPYGFALENYDGTGRWRQQDNNIDVDASGEINGRSFTTPTEFRAILAERKGDFRIAMVRKMLSYALGRGIEASDRQTVQQIADAVEADGDRFSSLILNVVESYPFQHARGSAAQVAEAPAPDSAAAELFHPVQVPPEPRAPAASSSAAPAGGNGIGGGNRPAANAVRPAGASPGTSNPATSSPAPAQNGNPAPPAGAPSTRPIANNP